MPSKKKSFFEFAKAFKELEEITQWFETQESLDLDVGLQKFEQGLALAQALQKKLSEVENKVKEIKKTFDLSV
ncbi:MAG: hypothetical protein UU08_C0001G0017 [Candidatus Uhrbacteria bacterium GW2011_GWE2_40_58]|nr:MAG: hypothetical protein UT94_C0001G0017 [Candidatus Uhrbacteria bacterium GW2011_GWF2_40_263]KKR68243.1 MAG: hypothetical protein UU08_C0001G0017 [Candidatus Uhrbacteria bacterium GW2011_GWE2_40_58]OGL92047.1 MAG: exodeoxyribonuclease VII small subunit [Candidatus Uhrbacteria bacterium RIFOXYA2_FULL_40_9]OGL97504.1 MAG: exodeoxyribonuclease VII small subunit [Candidatus Uhrbacteria bacterium RIFOXYB2_FULL_41_18]HBK35109.1 exodeoxyribonuclease VII small subunit [Candidatus Uhrbacteria bacte